MWRGPGVLADGRTWYFAAATEPATACFEGDRFIGVEIYVGFPRPQSKAVDALVEASKAGGDRVPYDLIFGAAFALLRPAHNLHFSAAEASALLHLDDLGVERIVMGLRRALWGRSRRRHLGPSHRRHG